MPRGPQRDDGADRLLHVDCVALPGRIRFRFVALRQRPGNPAVAEWVLSARLRAKRDGGGNGGSSGSRAGALLAMRTYLMLATLVMIGFWDVAANRGQTVRVVGQIVGGGLRSIGLG